MRDNRNALRGQLSIRDYFMLINMVLFIVAGGTLLYRAVRHNASWLAYLMAGLFLLAGGYRFYLFYHALKGGK